ncbi:hypothetical protein DMENIID0001_155800 [Sergentomyia squamirostris]
MAVLFVFLVLSLFSGLFSKQSSSLNTELKIVTNGPSRIINGNRAQNGQFPYQLMVRIYGGQFSNETKGTCSGSIVHPNWGLTAAHCIFPTTSANDVRTYELRAGSVYPDQSLQVIRVDSEDAFPHERYNPDTLMNDIALLKVNLLLGLGFTFVPNRVGSIELSRLSEAELVGKYLLVSGFGYIQDRPSNVSPDQLYYTHLTGISKRECQNAWRSVILPSTCFCATDKTSKQSSVCHGDSGGPIVYSFDNGNKVQIGVVSFGGDPYSLDFMSNMKVVKVQLDVPDIVVKKKMQEIDKK